MSRLFIHINAEELSDELPGNKAMLFALINSLGKLRMSVEDIAKTMHVGECIVRRWLKDFEEAGAIRREYENGKQMVIYSKGVNSVQYTESIRAKVPNQNGKKYRINTVQSTESTFNNNNKNNRGNNDFPPTQNPLKEEADFASQWDYVLECIQQFYETVLQRPYAPDFRTQTTDAKEIATHVDNMLRWDKLPLDDAHRRAWLSDFLQKGYLAGDTFIQEHFNLSTINKQFNTIINRIKNEKNNGSSLEARKAFNRMLNQLDGDTDDWQ